MSMIKYKSVDLRASIVSASFTISLLILLASVKYEDSPSL